MEELSEQDLVPLKNKGHTAVTIGIILAYTILC